MITIYIIRHEESIFNEQRIVTGNLNPSLTPRGLQGAERMGAYIHDFTIDHILTGSLDRYIQTALAIDAGRRIERIVDQRMNERSLGRFQGLKYDQIDTEGLPIQKYLLFKDILDDTSNPSIPSGESRGESIAEVTKRADEVLTERVLRYEEASILMVVSELWVNYFLNLLVPSPGTKLCFRLENGAYSEFHIFPSQKGKRIVAVERTNFVIG